MQGHDDSVGKVLDLSPEPTPLFLPPVWLYHEEPHVHMCGYPTHHLSCVRTSTISLLLSTQGPGTSTCGMVFPEDRLQEEILGVVLGYLGREFQTPGRLLEHDLEGMDMDSREA